jgi:MoaA/NifB/PqqE/SkfB family radical SAM enzyme
MELDMTNACGHRCPGCFGFHPERDRAAMSIAEAESVIRQARDLGVRGLTFTGGGEPLMNPATLDAVRYAAESGLDVGFITNGQRLDAGAADVLLESCVWIRVSLDAASPEVFRRTHGMGSAEFERALENTRALARRKRETGSRTTVGIGLLTSPETKQDIRAFAALGRELGVDYAQYRPLLRRHGGDEVDYSDPGILEEMLRAARDFSTREYKVVCSEHKYRRIAQGRVGRRYRKCYGQHFAAVVAADRSLYVCCHMRGVGKYRLGDLSERSMAEIWSDARRPVDLKDCPPLCRCDSFNEILWSLKHEGRELSSLPEDRAWEHKNFI